MTILQQIDARILVNQDIGQQSHVAPLAQTLSGLAARDGDIDMKTGPLQKRPVQAGHRMLIVDNKDRSTVAALIRPGIDPLRSCQLLLGKGHVHSRDDGHVLCTVVDRVSSNQVSSHHWSMAEKDKDTQSTD
jgi:hypothetical protein